MSELIRVVRYLMVFYSLAIFTLGIFIGLSMGKSHKPRDYPVQFKPEQAAPKANQDA